ncbi:diphthine--ammonia ligase isoform X3 [Petromyzon marinus]|uniref:Diphthine--ammonia ligase n=1 Tax=Petromyzon marinus TaxID=7757 RepID=A0AAJ7WVR2_PETMA|nr:diphthine--ammonia ligase isoform X3 [Petromyzon marinus]
MLALSNTACHSSPLGSCLGAECHTPQAAGGKDSCYNLMQCVAAGHQVVALANLQPVGKDELDSYMYQTVGHQAVGLYAEAMALPLYRRSIQGETLEMGRDYTEHAGDEVEDLYHLLKEVKEKEAVEGVSVGAILSDYQRLRVENVCERLGLTPLALLWHREQEELLQEMVTAGVEAILIKVAALGLDPRKHLGKSLLEMSPLLVSRCPVHSSRKSSGSTCAGKAASMRRSPSTAPSFTSESS